MVLLKNGDEGMTEEELVKKIDDGFDEFKTNFIDKLKDK